MPLPIEEEVIIGNDFCNAHDVSLHFDPDHIVCNSPLGRSPRHPCAPKRRYAANRELKKLEAERVDAPALPLRDLECPILESKIMKHGADKDDAYIVLQEEKDEFLAWLLEFFSEKRTILSKKEPLPLPPHRGPNLDHKVEYIAGTPDLDPAVAYPWSRVHTQPMLTMIDIYKRGGQFEPTTRKATASLIPVLKKDRTMHPVADLRKRNKITKSEKMQPVSATAMVNNVASAVYKMGNDLLRTFEQCRAMEEAEEKNVVASPVGDYMIKTAQQGDKNSPTTLQKNIFAALEGMLKKNVEAYANDLWVFGNVWRQLKLDCIEMYTRLYRYCFVISLESIQFCPEEYKVLGHIVKGCTIAMDPKQVNALSNYVRPETPRSMQHFLGAIDF
ncbi:hypothetical protein JCM6882_007584 [Rhodosporidiobolus microsporus]